MIAIVAIIGFSGAFAMNPPHDKVEQTYGVMQTVSGGWIVTASSGDCSGESNTCKVVTTAAPDEDGFISSENVERTLPGTFSKTGN